MTEAEQAECVQFLSDPAAHGLPAGAAVERIETHAAHVFLAGDRAYKLKKAIQRPYLDYSRASQRRLYCMREVELNTRTAPTLYLGHKPIRRSDEGDLVLGGHHGFIVDWLVEMNRFPAEAMADRALADGRFGVDDARDLAVAIAEFHREADETPDLGGAETMSWVGQGNLERVYDCIAAFPTERALSLLQRQLKALARHAPLMELRRLTGWTRRCHGDLHLGNVAILDGRPTPFDAIEFDDRLACIDVFYDLAFLLMDFERRGRPDLANAALNAYIEFGEGLAEQMAAITLLPLLISMRATIRAHIEATLALEGDVMETRSERLRRANTYMTTALKAMATAPSADAAPIVALGGLQGVGKSSVAATLAPMLGGPPGAVVLRADAIRKRLFGLPPTERLPKDAYTPVVSDRVMALMSEMAIASARGGRPVICDSVFMDPDRRQRLSDAAAAAKAPFVGVWLDAPQPTLEQRVTKRAEAPRPDASDADIDVLREAAKADPGDLEAWARISAGGDLAAVAVAVQSVVAGTTLP